MPAERADICVVGGGVCGMLSAYRLASSGCSVLLMERQEVGGESSWAGGGIVSPLYPWRYAAAVRALAGWSQSFYPELVRRLRQQTDIDPQLYVTGLYWLDLEDESLALDWALREARTLEQLGRGQLRERLPILAKSFERAIHLLDIANVRNPRLLKALKQWLRQSGRVRILENASVRRLYPQGASWRIESQDGHCEAQRVVLAAGAWSGQLLATLGLDLPVEPVKGQMILYKCAEDFLPAMVLAKGRYAIPRKDGHILVGSTLEHVGFDKTPTAEALASLKASAEALLPALAEAEVVGHWAGLRPGSPDGVPFIGEVPQYPGLWLNCGHYRNGLVLAPASCELLKNLMLGETPIVDPIPYSPAGRLGAA